MDNESGIHQKITARQPVELLSPAGCAESVYAAVAAGCGAVYIGGKDFSARSGAENFDGAQIGEIIDYCHLRGVKVYIAANTIYKNSELPALLRFLSEAYADGADAFIMQDIGAAAAVKKHLPGIPLHASTQMTAHSLSDVLFLASAGFSRVVLSREMSLAEIRRIKAASPVALECFVHGALCVCYSGRCLMSSWIGGRSGNRGKCAQPCRLHYELAKDGQTVAAGYLLSPKDMRALNRLEELISAGVTSLKIEGRMKTPEYVALTTSVYRARLDGQQQPDDEKKLLQIFNRGGFSEGYFDAYSGKAMMSTDAPKPIGLFLGRVESYDPAAGVCVIRAEEPLTPGDGIEIWTKTKPHPGTGINRKSAAGDRVTVTVKGAVAAGDAVYKSFDKALADEARRLYQKDTRKIDLTAGVKIKKGAEITLTLCHEPTGTAAAAAGEPAQAAENQPMSAEKIIAQLKKTGGTPFELHITEAGTEIDPDIFVPVSALNALRRSAAEAMLTALPAAYDRRLPAIRLDPPEKDRPSAQKELAVLVTTAEQLAAARSFDSGVARIYAESAIENIGDCAGLYIALPDIDRDHGHGRGDHAAIDAFERKNIRGYLVRTLGQLYYLQSIGSEKERVTDDVLNVSNRLSYDFLRQFAGGVTLSREINLADINEVGGAQSEIVIYGKT
ncbi:MAG: U32 family peptidase, partial [Clostridiales bacterium]|nr:U32 family peptidase [Clostridiales bacterium]